MFPLTVVLARKTFPDIQKKIEKNVMIQFFELREVMFNVTKHSLVPKHEVIDEEEEINSIVKRHNVKNKLQFPLILKTDPIARYYGMKPGNLVRVTRVSPSSGEYVMYRCCV